MGSLPPPGEQPPAQYAAQAYGPRTNGLAIASLVTGILSWVMCPLFAGVMAIIFGHIARGQIKRSGEAGGGLAIAGLVLGYVNLAGALLIGVVYALVLGGLILGGAFGGGSIASPSP